jgi:hypothetical protein
MVKAIHKGLVKRGDPTYEEGWTLYMGPQPKRPSETPSEHTPPKNSESTTPSAAANPAAKAEKAEVYPLRRTDLLK